MTHHAPIPPPDAAPYGPAPAPAPNSSRWTPAKMADFLRQLSATHSVSEAARSVGMSRQSAYRLRSRLKGSDFDLAWDVAFQHGYDNLAHAALERALNGVEMPVFFKGEQVGSYRRYDERLTVALLNTLRTRRRNVPILGRLAGEAEEHSERFDALVAAIAADPHAAKAPPDPGPMPEGELNRLFNPRASGPSSDELLKQLKEVERQRQRDDAGYTV